MKGAVIRDAHACASLARLGIAFLLTVTVSAASLAQTAAASIPPSGFAPGAGGASPSAADTYIANRAGFVGYSVVDAGSTTVFSGESEHRIRSASVIKVVIAAAAYEMTSSAGSSTRTAVERDVRAAIRYSDNNAAQRLYERIGRDRGVIRWWRSHGFHASDLTGDPQRNSTPWGYLNVDAQGLASFGARLRSGDVIDPEHTARLLSHMRNVTPSQRFGAAKVAAAVVTGAQPAVKNGWYPDAENWRVTCLAIIDEDKQAWRTVAIVTSYPVRLGVAYGQTTCATLSEILLRESATPSTPAGTSSVSASPTALPATGPQRLR